MIKNNIGAVGKWESVLVLFIITSVVLGWVLSPYFLNTENLLNQSRSFIVVGFLALGLAPIVITGDLDLSGESILALCAVILGLLFEQGVNVWVASFIVIIVGSIIEIGRAHV